MAGNGTKMIDVKLHQNHWVLCNTASSCFFFSNQSPVKVPYKPNMSGWLCKNVFYWQANCFLAINENIL
jgi:hypothetical protein